MSVELLDESGSMDCVPKGRKAMPKKNTTTNDNVMTPSWLAEKIVEHFQPRGVILDPCAGDGAFTSAMADLKALGYYCENREGAACYNGCDFFDMPAPEIRQVDYIVSNPPYSILTPWLEHSFKIAENVIYLVQATSPFFTARRRLAAEHGFGIREMLYLNCPPEWRAQKLSFGSGLAAVHWQLGWDDGIRETYPRDFTWTESRSKKCE